MELIKQQLSQARIVPVVVLKDLAAALPLAECLLRAELPLIEITLRTACAAAAIKQISEKFPQLCIGAGTILTVEALRQAQDAGARFGVAPGFDREVVEQAHALKMPFIPGVATASELGAAINCGCKIVKFFPAAAAGGLPLLKALLAAFGHLDISVMPTGGIDEHNYRDYLAQPAVIAVGSSWIVESKLLAESNWQEIEKRIRATKQ